MKLIPRPHYLNKLIRVINTPEIKIITGIRRAGKSKLLTSFTDYIIHSDPTANIIEIDLTKLRFESLKEYHALNDYVEERYKEGVRNYLMIDEIQMCNGFELVVNSLHSEEKYDIYLTGSNAFLLSSDLATLFTGRHTEIHVFPFSFKEYCTYFDTPDNMIQEAFTNYIRIGGLSGAYPYSRDADREKYIRGVYETIVIRDLVDKYALTNPTMIKRISHFLMDNIGNISSLRNISSGLTVDGMEVNHKTTGRYLDYLCNAFVFYEAKRYDIKGKSYLQSLSKYYIADTGIRYAELGKRNMD